MDYLVSYSHIRGFNYTPSTAFNPIAFWRDYDETIIERELTYAQRLGLNSARVFLAYVVYEREPQAFLGRVRHFVRAAHERGITVMPVIWDACFGEVQPAYEATVNEWLPNPGTERAAPDFWPAGERYCRDLVSRLRHEPGLLMWDVMNEPGDVYWPFVRHFCQVMKKLDPDHPITVGVVPARTLAEIGTEVDVLSYHDYLPTRRAILAQIDGALTYATDVRKPILVSETGCLARANPYDMVLEVFQSVGIGWYLWELMIGVSRWRDIHGIVYPDGTARDPSIVAAVQGFFRRRSGNIVAPNVNKEGTVTRVLARVDEWLGSADQRYAEGLALLECMANLLEAGELVPMNRPPTARVLALAEESAVNWAQLRRLVVGQSELLRSVVGPDE